MSTDNSAKISKLGRRPVDSEAINVRMEQGQIAALDDWRRRQPDLPNRPEAIRRLIESVLSPEKNSTVTNVWRPFTRPSQREKHGSPAWHKAVLREQKAVEYWIELGLEVRTANALVNDSIFLLSDLPSDITQLLRVPNIGKVGLNSIERIVLENSRATSKE